MDVLVFLEQLLLSARLENEVLDCIPQAIRPMNLEQAYATQDRFVELLGWEIGGWFFACTNPAIQKLLSLNEP